PEQERPVHAEAPDLLGRQSRHHERQSHGQDGHASREHERRHDARVVLGIGEELDKVVEPDEGLPVAERRDPEHAELERFERGPEEEDGGDRHLREHQQVRQPGVLEDRPLHRDGRPLGSGRYGLFCAANSFSTSLPLATASSRPCLAVFLPPKTFSSSPSITSRICTKLPSRMPWLFAVATRSGLAGTGFLPASAAGGVGGRPVSWANAVYWSGLRTKW